MFTFLKKNSVSVLCKLNCLQTYGKISLKQATKNIQDKIQESCFNEQPANCPIIFGQLQNFPTNLIVMIN